jgi:D-alanine-D-alanine ligase
MSLTRTRVAVIRGGPSHAYDESLKTGAYIISLLRDMPEAYEPLDIFISRNGEWHHGGLVREPHKALANADVVWNALHGQYGEDGEVQKLLESLRLPYTGSGIVASAFAHNKELSKEFYKKNGLVTPDWRVVTQANTDKTLADVFRNFFFPVIVKPATGIRALGVRLAHTFHELKDAVKNTFKHSPKVLVEEYVRGTVVSSAVIERAKGQDLYALMPAHLETHFRRVRPSPEENKEIEKMAKVAHQALGLRHYSSSDFIITPKGKIHILETNSLPILHEDSLMHRSLESTGWRSQDFADHCLKLALGRS